MPPLLRAQDSMNSSAATAVPDRSRGLRSQASLEIDAILAGTGREDAEFLSMLRNAPAHGGGSQGTQLDDGSGSGTDGTDGGVNGTGVDGNVASGSGAGSRQRRSSGAKTRSRGKGGQRDILAAGPMANSFAFEIPDMSSQPAIPTLLSGPGPLSNSQHQRFNSHNSNTHSQYRHSPIEHPGQSISPDQLRYSNDHFDAHANTMAYVHMQAGGPHRQGHVSDNAYVQPGYGHGQFAGGLSGVNASMSAGGMGMDLDLGLASPHANNNNNNDRERYRPGSAMSEISANAAGSEYSFSATDVSSVDHHNGQEQGHAHAHGQGGQGVQGDDGRGGGPAGTRAQGMRPGFTGMHPAAAGGGDINMSLNMNGAGGAGGGQDMQWGSGTPHFEFDPSPINQLDPLQVSDYDYKPSPNLHLAHPHPHPHHHRGSTSTGTGGYSNSVSPVPVGDGLVSAGAGPSGSGSGGGGGGGGGAGARSNIGPIRGGGLGGAGSSVGGGGGGEYGDDDPASRQQRLERMSFTFYHCHPPLGPRRGRV